jgi:DNA-binding CsgD family transcriptional regulator
MEICMASKSDPIQFKYREMSLEPSLLGNFCESDGLYSTDYQKTDELLDLVDELNERIREIITVRLTDRQREVMELLYYHGLTQTEVALRLGLCQPTIHKTTSGNLDYKNGGKRYGGALKKIKKICDEDERISFIMKRITEIKTGSI